MARYRINPGSALTAFSGVAVLSDIGGLTWYLNQPEIPKPQAPALREWMTQTRDGIEHQLAGPGQIVTQQGPLTYTFNFDSGHVFIIGGQINHAFTTRQFENHAMVQAVRDTGCAIAATLTGRIAAYKASPSFGVEYGPYVDEHATIAAAFLKNHCQP